MSDQPRNVHGAHINELIERGYLRPLSKGKVELPQSVWVVNDWREWRAQEPETWDLRRPITGRQRRAWARWHRQWIATGMPLRPIDQIRWFGPSVDKPV
jgi:hypothetical protein